MAIIINWEGLFAWMDALETQRIKNSRGEGPNECFLRLVEEFAEKEKEKCLNIRK